jgi:hypothetical protein
VVDVAKSQIGVVTVASGYPLQYVKPSSVPSTCALAFVRSWQLGFRSSLARRTSNEYTQPGVNRLRVSFLAKTFRGISPKLTITYLAGHGTEIPKNLLLDCFPP